MVIPFTLRLPPFMNCRLSWTAGGLMTGTRADLTRMAVATMIKITECIIPPETYFLLESSI